VDSMHPYIWRAVATIDRALTRGGGRRAVPIDLLDAKGRYGREPAHELTAERLFERRWAFELLGRVLARCGFANRNFSRLTCYRGRGYSCIWKEPRCGYLDKSV
jgi:hypothetical protein